MRINWNQGCDRYEHVLTTKQPGCKVRHEITGRGQGQQLTGSGAGAITALIIPTFESDRGTHRQQE